MRRKPPCSPSLSHLTSSISPRPLPRRNLTVLVVSLVVGFACYWRAEQNPWARNASRAYRLIDGQSLENPADDELFAGAVHGMVAVLRSRGDEHSGYLAPTLAEPFEAEIRQQFGGVGVRVGLEGDPPQVVVVEPPIPGTPAYASGVRAGDAILAVDGVTTVGRSLEEVVGMTRGPVGEPVRLTVLHAAVGDQPASEETIRLVREIIRVPSIVGDRRTPDGGWRFPLDDEPGVAHVRINVFGEQTADELRAVLQQLRDEGVRRVVLDLRQNAGGAVDAAVDVAGLFLADGAAIVSTRGRDGRVLDAYHAAADGPFRDFDVAVLIDGDTASASEIVAAALQDNHRAKVYGERSYGKGTVQTLMPIGSSGALLKLTTASYWRPSGVNIHRLPDTPEDAAWGVSPDEGAAVPLSDAERQAWVEWRRARDLAIEEAADAPGPLEADPALAAAVQSFGGPPASDVGLREE